MDTHTFFGTNHNEGSQTLGDQNRDRERAKFT
jgi:hypothetical protein